MNIASDHFFISLKKLGKMSSMKNCAWQKVTKVSSCGRKRLWLSQRQRSLSLSSVILVNMLNNRRKEKSRGSVENWWQKSHKKSYQGLKFKENDFQIAIGAVINIRCFWEHVREKIDRKFSAKYARAKIDMIFRKGLIFNVFQIYFLVKKDDISPWTYFSKLR